jgi:hypothetical protein
MCSSVAFQGVCGLSGVTVAVANAATVMPPLGVPTVLAEHASHLCACSQTSVEIAHIYQI